MKLTIDNIDKSTEIINLDWQLISDSITKLIWNTLSYCILENERGDYIQCAGKSDRLTVELRELNNMGFKHYRFGKLIKKFKLKVIWAIIDCEVGPIRIHVSEDHTSNDAISISSEFFNKTESGLEFNIRNINRDFKRQ